MGEIWNRRRLSIHNNVSDLVPRHHLNAGFAQDGFALPFAVAEHHLQEPNVVECGGIQSSVSSNRR